MGASLMYVPVTLLATANKVDTKPETAGTRPCYSGTARIEGTISHWSALRYSSIVNDLLRWLTTTRAPDCSLKLKKLRTLLVLHSTATISPGVLHMAPP